MTTSNKAQDGRVKHGLRSVGFGRSRLPRGFSWVSARTSVLRDAIEAALALERREGPYVQALTQSVLRHETRVLMISSHLRKNWATMSDDQRLAWMRDQSAASDKRDRCLEKLGLDQASKQTILESFYSEARTEQEE